MYIANSNLNENLEEITSFIQQNSFGLLINNVNALPWASHIPMKLSSDAREIHGHVSRGNKQWKSWEEQSDVLAIFQGPHAYISSSWYDHQNVSTWNYIAVHVYGKIRLQSDEELLDSLKALTRSYEKHSEKPFYVEDMTASFLKSEMRGAVGFVITDLRFEASYKLSQNRDDKNYKEIIAHLEKIGDPQSKAMAEEMRKRRSI